jgi:hypothetical protein
LKRIFFFVLFLCGISVNFKGLPESSEIISLSLKGSEVIEDEDKLNVVIPPSEFSGSAQEVVVPTLEGQFVTESFYTPSEKFIPTKPSYVTAQAGNRSVILSWYPSEGINPISGYLIYRSVEPDVIPNAPINLKPVTATNYQDDHENSVSAPLNRVSYYYWVRAYDTDTRLSEFSEVVSATPGGPLLPPGNIKIEESNNQIVLSWIEPLSTGENNLAGYKVYKSRNSGQYLGSLNQELFSKREFVDRDVKNGENYFYVITAVDTEGNESSFSLEISATPYIPLKAPTILTAMGVGDEVVRLEWEPSLGGGTFEVVGYKIFRSTQLPVDLKTGPINRGVISGKENVFFDSPENSISPPKKGLDYFYVVTAVDKKGKLSLPSSESPPAGPIASLTSLSGAQFDIASGTSLAISGRKTIDLSYTHVEQAYRDSGAPFSAGVSQGFLMDQQLQVRLTGKVGPKITVDVDYDDKKESSQQQKISVVYKGDTQEVFKEFAFGDIQTELSSTRTQFAGYNKSLFGAKVKIESQDNKFRLTAFGAQTKGYTETKRIVGGWEEAKTGNNPGRVLVDDSFIKYKYYYLSRDRDLIFGRDYIVPESVQIWLSAPGNQNFPNARRVPKAIPDTGEHYFLPINRDQFTLDMQTGLISFNVPIFNNTTIAVGYIREKSDGSREVVGLIETAGGWDFDFTPSTLVSNYVTGKTDASARLIQDGDISQRRYDAHMSCQFYSLGNRDILNPQLDPDFKFVIYGRDKTPVFEADSKTLRSNILQIDSRTGMAMFQVPYPFKQEMSYPADITLDESFSKMEEPIDTTKQDVYNREASNRSNYTINVEYKYRVTSYSLRFNIIRGSEVIFLNGRRLTRDFDYFLDYDTGILVFNNPDLINEDSVIEATYEYLPFGGQFTSTILGLRGEYDFTKDLSMGITYLYNSSESPLEAPEVRSTPFSLQVLDADIQAKISRESLEEILTPLIGLKPPLDITLRTEFAQSSYQINTYSRNNENGVGIIDNFQSVENIISSTLEENNWMPASRPTTIGGNLNSGLPVANRKFSKMQNEYGLGHDAQLKAAEEGRRDSKFLTIQYAGFSDPQAWDAFVTSLGRGSQNLNEYSYLEIWIKTEQPVRLNLDVGLVSEDANDNGLLDMESRSGVLRKGEDIGIYNFMNRKVGGYPLPSEAPALYVNPNYWGAENNFADTEDLNGDGSLNRTESFYRFSQTVFPISNPETNDFILIQIPLSSADIISGPEIRRSTVPGDPDYFARIENLRLWINQASTDSGKIYIESIKFKGNRWQLNANSQAVVFGNISVTADSDKLNTRVINRIVDANLVEGVTLQYEPNLNFFRTENEQDQDREQSLMFEYKLNIFDQTDGQPHYLAKRILSSTQTVDLGSYKNLRLDIYIPSILGGVLPGEVLLIRLGVDDVNYFQYSIPLDNIPYDNWHTITLPLEGVDGSRTKAGRPYLRFVKQVSFAILNPNAFYNSASFEQKERFWINNLRVTDAFLRQGNAFRAQADYVFGDGKFRINEEYRDVESDFVLMDRQGDPPRRRERRHIITSKVDVLEKVPFTLSWEQRELYTEIPYLDDPLYNRNFVDPDEWSETYSGNVTFSSIPNLNVMGNFFISYANRKYLPDYVETQNELLTLETEPFLPHHEVNRERYRVESVLTVPEFVPLFKNDTFRSILSFEENTTRYYEPTKNEFTTQFKDNFKLSFNQEYRYEGTWDAGELLKIRPGVGVSFRQDTGHIAVSNSWYPYYILSEENGRRTKENEWIPQSEIINPRLTMELKSFWGISNPRVNYDLTYNRDYVYNSVRVPGSLSFNTDLDFAEMLNLPKQSLPRLSFQQQFQVNSEIDNQPLERPSRLATSDVYYKIDPQTGLRVPVDNIDLVNRNYELKKGFNTIWWVRTNLFPGSNFLNEDFEDPLHIENIARTANRKSSTTFNTQFDATIFPGWRGRFTPRVTLSQDRNMSAPQVIILNEQLTFGTGLVFNQPALLFKELLKPTSLMLNYTLTQDQGKDTLLRPTRERESHNFNVRLPLQPTDKLTVTLEYLLNESSEIQYLMGGATGNPTLRSLQRPALRMTYFLKFDNPVRLWNFWPFYGRELRLTQSFKLDNDLSLELKNETYPTFDSDISNDTYTLYNQISYNVMQNLNVRFNLTQKWFFDHRNDEMNFYSIRMLLGMELLF